jgi:hypothetical protein
MTHAADDVMQETALKEPTVPGPAKMPAAGAAHAVADALPYAKIMGLLHIETGIDFSHYRATTIMRRTLRRMALVAKVTLAEYADYLAGSAIELSALARDVLIHVTSFFRDQTAFAAVTAVVLPALTQDRTAESPLRLWIAGCSTGQEVYSLAIALLEHLRGISSGLRVQIFATDIPGDYRRRGPSRAPRTVFHQGCLWLPGDEGDPRSVRFRQTRCHIGHPILAHRFHQLPECAHLSRAGAPEIRLADLPLLPQGRWLPAAWRFRISGFSGELLSDRR